ncbi:NFYC factor, partial [Atractosteus spatula]|nr:NFYC factor [Atractosteus spatula]
MGSRYKNKAAGDWCQHGGFPRGKLTSEDHVSLIQSPSSQPGWERILPGRKNVVFLRSHQRRLSCSVFLRACAGFSVKEPGILRSALGTGLHLPALLRGHGRGRGSCVLDGTEKRKRGLPVAVLHVVRAGTQCQQSAPGRTQACPSSYKKRVRPFPVAKCEHRCIAHLFESRARNETGACRDWGLQDVSLGRLTAGKSLSFWPELHTAPPCRPRGGTVQEQQIRGMPTVSLAGHYRGERPGLLMLLQDSSYSERDPDKQRLLSSSWCAAQPEWTAGSSGAIQGPDPIPRRVHCGSLGTGTQSHKHTGRQTAQRKVRKCGQWKAGLRGSSPRGVEVPFSGLEQQLTERRQGERIPPTPLGLHAHTVPFVQFKGKFSVNALLCNCGVQRDPGVPLPHSGFLPGLSSSAVILQVPDGRGLGVLALESPGSAGSVVKMSKFPSKQRFWVMAEVTSAASLAFQKDFRVQELPLARIKKIMKLDEDVKMISAEAPVLFAKAAQIFITELTLRAWIHTEDNKRRTLQSAGGGVSCFAYLLRFGPGEPGKQWGGAAAMGAPPLHFPDGRGLGVLALESPGSAGSVVKMSKFPSKQRFWVMAEVTSAASLAFQKDFRVQELPLARIKKIMKLDEDVKRNDIAMAITKFDQFDFLIDIVPRDELKPPKRQGAGRGVFTLFATDGSAAAGPGGEIFTPSPAGSWERRRHRDQEPWEWLCIDPVQSEEVRQSVAPAEPVQYYFTLAQQPGPVQVQGQQQGQQAATPATTALQPGQIIIAQPQQGQVLQEATVQQLYKGRLHSRRAEPPPSCAPVTMQVGEGQQVQIVQAAAQGQTQAAQPAAGQTMQVMQQIITNTGEIQQIPVQLNTGQLQYIRLAQPVSGTQVVQGQIQTLTTNTQQISQTEVQQGQQQFNQFTDGQQLYQIQQVTMPAGQELAQPMFIQSTSQSADGQSAPVTMQVGEGQQVQIVQAAAQGQTQAAQPAAGQTMQVMQQIITNTGEIQQIPVQLNTGQLQYIRLAQPVSGTQVVQGQIQTLTTNTQQISQTEVQQGQQQFNQFTDGQQLYQIQQVTMPAGQELAQPMFIQSTSQSADGQVTTQVSAD